MLFNSAIFVLLFIAVYSVYWFLPIRGKHYLIIVASLLFYSWYSVPFLILFLALIIVNYLVSLALLKKKSALLLSLTVGLDLAVLGFFKYFYLLAHTIGWALGIPYMEHLRANWEADYDIVIILPIAISFYTFQIIAYVVDTYRGVISEPLAPRRFFVFILFFPQFVAGPILRSEDFIPQIDSPTIDQDRMRRGILLLIQGTIKKVLIADNLGKFTGAVWVAPQHYDAIVLWTLPFSFMARIYCDFSGYTDMARGMAKLMGYEIPENFSGPFLSTSMSELWTRWHITLSTWLRDYIYIPLGGSRLGEFRTVMNLLITMGLGGLWHGATWNMLLWGIYIGFFLVAERELRVAKVRLLPEGRIGDTIRRFYVVIVFGMSALFFASPDLERTTAILNGMFSFQRGNPVTGFETVFLLIVLSFVFNYLQYFPRLHDRLVQRPRLQYAMTVAGTFITWFLVYLYGDASGSFIYFAF